MRAVLGAVLLALALANGAWAVTQEQRNRAHFTQHYVDSVDRRTLENKPISSRFCALSHDSRGNPHCQWEDYGQFLGRSLIPGLVLAVFFLIVLVIFWIGRLCFIPCCCGTFGGVCPSRGVCIPSRDEFTGYWMASVVISGVFLVFAVIGGLVAMALMIVGEVDAHSGAINVVNNAVKVAQEVHDNATIIYNTALTLQYTADAAAQFSSVLSYSDRVLSKAREFRRQFKKWENVRHDVFIAIFSVICLLLVSVFIGFCLPPCLWCPAVVIVPAVFVGWLMFAGYSDVAIVITDMCHELHIARDLELVQAVSWNPAFDRVLECNNGTGYFDVFQAALDARQQAYDATCTDYRDFCAAGGGSNSSFPDQVVYCTDTSCNTSFTQYIPTTVLTDVVPCQDPACPVDCPLPGFCVQQNRTVRECAAACVNLGQRQACQELLNQTDTIAGYENLLNTYILPLVRCAYVPELLRRVTDSGCVKGMSGVGLAWLATIILSAFLLFLEVATIVALKRLSKSNWMRTKLKDADISF